MIVNILFFFKLISFSLFVLTASQKSNPKFLGCFLAENLLSLGEESRVVTSISPQSCSQFCIGKKYLFFITKQNTCYCSKNYISKLMKQFDNECTIKCSGDNTASCGGTPNLVSLYITDSSKLNNFLGLGGFPIPIYLGCYSETPNDDENRLLKGPAGPYNNNTPQKCTEICFKMGYLYFGVTYGSECWCGNQKPLKSLKVEDINCDSPCSGDNKQFCGGGWKMGIYSTGITDYATNKFLGCFEDMENKPKGKYSEFNLGSNNSPRRCMNLCNMQRFKYASVKGNVCECKNYEPDYNLQRSLSYCKTPCHENPFEYCGGSTASSIYKDIYSEQQGAVAVNHIGCFNNLKRHPVLHGWGVTFSRLTPKQCVYSCYARKFSYAALVSSNECLCSLTKPSEEAKTDDNMCANRCSGSSQLSCGGINAMNIYSTGLELKTDTVGHHYLGCYEENEKNRIFNGYSRSFSVNTPEFCSNLCYKFGYSYSGVTYKSECFCGSQFAPKLNRVEDKQCNTKCSGDANQYCGGGWKMGVFSTGLSDFAIEDKFVGCFVQQENTLGSIKFELINTNTPGRCSAICHNAGYQFAGVTGVNCFCNNQAPENDQKISDSDCDTNCVGDVSLTCGGEDRIQIYDLMRNNAPELTNLDEEFEVLNLQSLWSHEIYIPQEPDYEFVIYNNSGRNSFVKNGELLIRPTILSDNFVKRGCLSLIGCTKEGSSECEKNASSYNIIPPIITAKLTTKNYLTFPSGQLEVVAKLPSGDWIVSEIAVVSKSNNQNKLVLAKSFGNANLKCNGVDESNSVLKFGLKVDEQFNVKSNLMKLTSATPWSDNYNSFLLSWTPESIIFKINGESNTLDKSNLPQDVIFDSEFYISIGMSVGGINVFDDSCTSDDRPKPWKNTDPKATLHFWQAKNFWEPTWNTEKSTLRIKSVKLTH